MNTKYGYAQEDWDKAKEEMWHALVERAKVEDLIYYSDLADNIRTIRLEPHSYAMSTMLLEAAIEEENAGRPMLTAVVVHKEDGWPGPGFYNAAEKVSRDTSDPEKCWSEELKKVYAYWSSR